MTKPIRVAMVAACPFPHARGTPVRILRMAQTLSDSGVDLEVVTYHLGERSEPLPFTIHRIPRLPFYRKVSPGPGYMKLLIVDPILTLTLFRLHRRHNYDIIHAHHAEGLLSCWPIRVLDAAPVIYDAHTLLGTELHHYRLLFRKGMKKTIGRFLDRALPRLADHVICVSEQINDYLVQEVGIAPERVSIIPNGIELDHFAHPEAPNPAHEPGSFTLGYAGNFAEYQGIDTMIEAVGILGKSYPRIRLRLYSEGSLESHRPSIVRLKMEDRVELLPTTFRELPKRLAESDIVLNPRAEGAGTPTKLLNYMAAGKPIVTFAETGHLIQHGKTGWVVPGDDPASFAEGIRHLLENQELAARLGKAAREHMERSFSWRSRGQQVLEIYEKLLRGR